MSSASPLIDFYDAQMLDFAHDLDVPMNNAASTEFLVEALMDHDGNGSTSTYGEHATVEVDMEEYAGDNAEYEMTDETTEYHHHGDEPLDVEVYDISLAPSPFVPHQPLQPSVGDPIESEHPELTSSPVSEHFALPNLPNEPESEVHHVPLDHSVSDVHNVEPLAPGAPVSSHPDSGAVASEQAPSAEVPYEDVPATSEFHEQTRDIIDVSGHTFEVPASADTNNEAPPHMQASAEEHHTEHPSLEVTQHENSNPSADESLPLAGVEVIDGGHLAQEEQSIDQVAVTEGEVVDPLQISDGVYIDPPPAVLLSIAASEQPEFSLFNQPEAESGSGSTSAEVPEGELKGYSLLLDSRPTLYYEPLSHVFEALRLDEELLARIPHSFEGELVLDAYDLQLVVSEDNVHSHEISLHDLNILHDGSDFAGPLRLHLRASVPRFIVRYYALQEQVQRLNLAIEAGEIERYQEHVTPDEDEGRTQHDQVEEVSPATANEPELLEVPASAEAQGPIGEPVSPSVPTEENEVLEETEETPAVPEPATEYHEVAESTDHALEHGDDYEGTNAGDEDEFTKSESLDADQVHGLAGVDTDAAATVTEQESEYGGEQSEYLDYAHREEYDEGYSEEHERGAPDVEYGESGQYDEAGQDAPPAADETQGILPGPNQDEEELEVMVTPMPTSAVLEPEFNETDPGESSTKSSLVEQDNSTTRTAAGETSTDTAQDTQAEGSRHPSKTRAEPSPGEDESDSNFIAMLEREADAELDRTFNPSNSGEKDGIEDFLQNEETWDDWDDADAEGEDDQEYWVDPDVVSNGSSTTLSSKASSKRAIEEVDFTEEDYVEELQSSPGSKRPRVR
ncbi:hypothetical protein BDN67DRAFT_1072006 [Paxillus ammoniavirescens]|nr:hypothetical protein BDN67DRAFT_1072006 [Paxillus ammoniavirescens]